MNDGGSAFPGDSFRMIVPDSVPDDVKVILGKIVQPTNGMTLRDYFAAKAMQSILILSAHERMEDLKQGGSEVNASWWTAKEIGINEPNGDGCVPAGEIWSMEAFQIADAMLKERDTP